jgi:adenylate kinase
VSRSVPPTHIVVFGRPGSGKSTLAARIGAQHGYVLVQTGELLRRAVRKGDWLGKRVERHLTTGNLVPDRLIFELLEHCLEAPADNKLLFDGFPRTMGQVTLLEQFESKLHFQIEAYLEIAVSRAEAVARQTGRRVCPTCGATYHVLFKPPKVAEICDLDGSRLNTRPDDSLEVVQVRQQVYDDHALAILEYYSSRAPERFFRVNGEQPLEGVYEEACRILGLKR